MIVAGCDVGSTTGKAVILENGKIAAYTIIPCKPRPAQTAELVMGETLQKIGLSSFEELDYIVGTGYGRLKIPFANDNISEISIAGGCAKNVGLIDVLEKKLETELVRLDEDPQIVGALGAAYLAARRFERSRVSE